eukprot:9917129-Prorocentrum_lima.AAC.1
MWIRKDGATRWSAPFAIETTDWSSEQDDFDLVDVDDEQPLMAHAGQMNGLPHEVLDNQDHETSSRQE